MPRQTISLDELDDLETDEKHQLYWKGRAVVMEQRFTLGIIERWIAGAAAVATVVAAMFPIGIHFHWW